MVKNLKPIHMAILACENLECKQNKAGKCTNIKGHVTRTCGGYSIDPLLRSPHALPSLTLDPRFKEALRPRRIL